MKIKLINTLIFFSLLFSLYSCFNSHCINLFFEQNETYWTDVYSKGDTLIFTSNFANGLANHNDTIFIVDKRTYKPKGDCNPIEVSNYDRESCIVDYAYKHDTILSDNDYFVQHVKENTGLSLPVIRVYGLEYSKQILNDTTIILKATGIKLEDCYTFHKQDCFNSLPKFKIKTFIWSKKQGLVMFIGESGEKFELLKKIHRPKK